jgi:hypothetical protein
MKKPKIGIIKKFFIVWKLERITKGELALQTYLKEVLDELLTLKPGPDTMELINELQLESIKATAKITQLQVEKKKTYFQLI